MTTQQWFARAALMLGAIAAFGGGIVTIVFGAKIDLTNGIQAQAFGLADIAVAALLVIAANSFNRPHS